MELAVLELYGNLPHQSLGNARISRVLLEQSFTPNLLLEWLNGNMKASKTSSDSESLDDLAIRGKLRALDVNSGEVVVLTSLTAGVTLSYVWGAVSSSVKCPARHHQKVFREVNIETLPATIRDATHLLRALGQRYLWVDAYCIDQDDPTDKAELVSKMDRIYQNAVFTIVAADGHDANAGLRRLHFRATDIEIPLRIVQNDVHLEFLPALPSYKDALQQTFWSTRGWTYQEMMLSSINVIFTPVEVILVSPKGIERESCKIETSLKGNGDGPINSRNR